MTSVPRPPARHPWGGSNVRRFIDELRLLHAIRLSVVATDAAGRLTFVNDAAADLYGARRDQLVGRPLTDLVGDPVRAEETRRRLRAVVDGELWRDEVSLRRVSGEPFLARIVATPLRDAAGTALGAVVVSEDITELRVAEAERDAGEQRLRLALTAARLGTWHWDIATGENVWDARLEEIYGLPPGGFGGSFDAWMALLHPDDVPGVIETVNAAMASPSPYRLDTRVIWPDGTVRSIEAWGEVTTDEAGTPTGTIGCVRDVTDEVETRHALTVALDAERQAARRTSMLLAVTADLSGAQTLGDVERAVVFHLAEFGKAFGGRAELGMPGRLRSSAAVATWSSPGTTTSTRTTERSSTASPRRDGRLRSGPSCSPARPRSPRTCSTASRRARCPWSPASSWRCTTRRAATSSSTSAGTGTTPSAPETGSSRWSSAT